MASVEAEVFLIGKWKNFHELEEDLCLEELQAILKASRDTERERQKFAASLKGIDLGSGGQDSVEERFEQAKRRAAIKIAEMQGLNGELELERRQFSGIGIRIEEEGE